jgi:hypothetical protein
MRSEEVLQSSLILVLIFILDDLLGLLGLLGERSALVLIFVVRFGLLGLGLGLALARGRSSGSGGSSGAVLRTGGSSELASLLLEFHVALARGCERWI